MTLKPTYFSHNVHCSGAVKGFLLLFFGLQLLFSPMSGRSARAAENATYTGSQSCKPCHEEQFDSFMAHTEKADSYQSVAIMRKGLTDSEYRECLECHTTGYGKPGGFVSVEATPHLKNAGCEVCHGPGSVHVETEDPEDIQGELTISDCKSCHAPDRVAAFNFKPLIYGGAH